MRLIDGDALKRRAQKVATEAWKMKITGKVETILNQFIDWINDAPTIEPEPQWIPCNERLPEDKTAYYLATVANRGLFFTTTVNNNVDYVRWDYDRRKGKDSWHWRTERTVLAWMPLPEPYQEGEN